MRQPAPHLIVSLCMRQTERQTVSLFLSRTERACSFTCTKVGSPAQKWGLLHKSGVTCTKVGSPAPKWGHLHQSGVSCTKVGSPEQKWGLLHKSGVTCTKVGSPAPKWDLLHQSGVSCTKAEAASSFSAINPEEMRCIIYGLQRIKTTIIKLL